MNFADEVKMYLDVMEIRKDVIGEPVICFKRDVIGSDNPYYEGLSNIIHKFPGDASFAYQQVYNCLCWLKENSHLTYEELEDAVVEAVDAQVDVYTSDLTHWLAQNINHVYFLTEILEEYDIKGGFRLLAMAQFKAIAEIWGKVVNLFVKKEVR